MRLKDHLILGGFASAVLYPALGKDSALFFAGSVLIDIDHYLEYLFHNGFRDFGVTNMFRYHEALRDSWGRPDFLNFEAFHTFEFVVAVLAASLLIGSAAIFALFMGLAFHIACDAAFLLRLRIFRLRANSFIEYLIRKRGFERMGLFPSAVHEDALKEIAIVKALDGFAGK
ncbi:MAG: hypothetical protein HYV24_03775 [Deltaproteobacteria bacterium]|nr:hypothetical protein [Deltaproteobacteria bacterium]